MFLCFLNIDGRAYQAENQSLVRSADEGGAIRVAAGGSLSIVGCNVSGFVGARRGGAIYVEAGGTLTVVDSLLSDNGGGHNHGGAGASHGGALFVERGGVAHLYTSKLHDNIATAGGAVYSHGGEVTLSRCSQLVAEPLPQSVVIASSIGPPAPS